MTGGDNVNSHCTDEEDLHGEGKVVNIIETTDIYCGRPTAGYQVVRQGLDVKFAPDLAKVHTLIDEYYNGQRPGSKTEGED